MKKNLTVGITIGFDSKQKDIPYNIYANGLRQHIFLFYDVLKEIDIIDNVYIVNCGTTLIKEQKFTKEFEEYNYKFVELKEIENDLDVIFELGIEIPMFNILKLKKQGTKIIGYGAGNSYVIALEKILFGKQTGNLSTKNYLFDGFWTNAQHEKTNRGYWEMMYKTKVTVLPHIWSSKFLDKNPIKYQKLNDNPRISILEPNINVVKTFIYSLLIIEKFYISKKENKNKIKHVYVTNSNKFKDNATFKRIIKSLDIFNDKIASFEGRFKTYNFLKQYTDIVITNQWENGLNYLYYEILYLHYPLLHNSIFLKNVGYYYPEFNINIGAKQLEKIINTHNNNIEDYNKKADDFLWTINPKNQTVIDIYKKELIKLFK